MNGTDKTAETARRRREPRRATPDYLERAALHYLERFATSSANLRRVLMAKVTRSARAHGTDPEEGAAFVDGLIERYRRSGLLDDRGYADMKAGSLRRRGVSARGVRAKLAAKGLDPDIVEHALERVDEDAATDPDLQAAVKLARRRRLGPFRDPRHRAACRERDMAALGRAGFDFETARRVVDADDPEALDIPEE